MTSRVSILNQPIEMMTGPGVRRPSEMDESIIDDSQDRSRSLQCGATPCGGPRPSDSFLLRSEGLDHTERLDHAHGASTGLWLRQVESYLEDTGMAGLASAWAMARRSPKDYRRKVDAATRCSGVCPHT